MAIFSPESKFSKIMMRLAWGCYLNLLWIVCSLPIITVGASTTALYYVTLKIAEDREGDITQQFFRAFRSNFKQATQLWLMLLLLGVVLGVDTVELAGGPFEAHVAAGDTVKAGDLLITADLDAIKAAGKPTATMVIVTNTDDYASVTPEVGAVKAGEKLVTVAK